MYKKYISLLEQQGVQLEKGLTQEEIELAEKIYDIKFPKSLSEFLMTALPVSKDFYNWRNMEESNVRFIKQMIELPKMNIYNEADEIYWNDEWGEEPENIIEFITLVREKLVNAPKLIPIFAHRYIPMVNGEEIPILSIHGVDVIYYAKTLEEYINAEFLGINKKFSSLDEYMYVPFWSDIM